MLSTAIETCIDLMRTPPQWQKCNARLTHVTLSKSPNHRTIGAKGLPEMGDEAQGPHSTHPME